VGGPTRDPPDPVEPDTVDPELNPNPSPVPAVVVAVEPVEPAPVVAVEPVEPEPVEPEPVEPEPVEPVGLVAEGEAVVAVVVDVDVAVSGETHPAGGDAAPCWPGISTLPAHPKSENVTD